MSFLSEKVRARIASYTGNKNITNGSIYIVGTLIQSGVGFLLLPILARYLSEDDFANAELFVAYSNVLVLLFLWGTSTYVYRYFAENPIEEFDDRFRAEVYAFYIKNALTVCACVGLFCVLLPKVNLWLMLYAVLYSFTYSFVVYEMTVLQIKKKARRYVTFSIFLTLSNLLVTLCLIWGWNFGYQARVLGYIVPSLCLLMFFLSKCPVKEICVFLVRRNVFKGLFVLGAPFFISGIASWLTESVDRIMLSELMTLKDVALYSFAYKFGMVILILNTAISRAWYPFVVEHIAQERRIYKGILQLSVLCVLFSVCYVGAMSFLYQYIAPPAYQASFVIFILICVGYFFDMIWKLCNAFLVAKGFTSAYTIITIISGGSNIVSNALLIPRYGTKGAAYATLLSFALGVVFSLLVMVVNHFTPKETK